MLRSLVKMSSLQQTRNRSHHRQGQGRQMSTL